MEAAPPCRVCGGTDLNLVDGYYYCVECGTQDVTARETIIEYTAREDGTFAHTTSKKITTAPAQERDLSPEWYKWHVLNFVVAGLGEELVSLGAGPGFRLRLLWLWAKYMQKFREKTAPDGTPEDIDNSESTQTGIAGQGSNGNEQGDSEDDGQSDEDENGAPTFSLTRKYSVSKQNMLVVQAILYTALNASESEIQAGDLIRFMKEERVSCKNCLRFIPKDFFNEKVYTVDAISKSYASLIGNYRIRGYAMTLYKTLRLGKPPAANLHKLVARYVTELCLPSDFRNIVFSLMDFVPVSLELDFTEGIRRLPDYEGVAMAYIVIALKICFGLDGWYENTLSDAVAQENEAKNHAKAYKHSLFLDGSDRLFSFREWSVYLEFRKHIISMYYFHVAINEKANIDNQVFISHTKNRVKKDAPSDVSDEVMMAILDKLLGNIEGFTAPKIEFPSSLTPLTTYSDAILRNSGDPVIQELLGEDFSQYSMKYVIGDLELDPDMIISGVSFDNLVIKPEEDIKLENVKHFKQLVYVRNCENDNWLVTKPPNSEHLHCTEDDNSCMSTNDSVMESIDKTETEDFNLQRTESIETLILNKATVDMNADVENVFDDDFNVTKDELWCSWQPEPEVEASKELLNHNVTEIDYGIHDDSITNILQNEEPTIDPETFDRDFAIEQLLEAARKEYRISTLTPRAPSKRKPSSMNSTVTVNNCVVPEPKKPRTAPSECAKYGQAKSEVKDICKHYYEAVTKRQNIMMDINKCLEDENSSSNVINSTQIQEPREIEGMNHIETENCIDEENNISDKNVTENGNNCNVETSLNEEQINDDNCGVSQELSPEKTDHFDEMIYDTEQLYLKLNENFGDESTETEDVKIIELLRRKEKELKEAKKGERLVIRDLGDEIESDTSDNQLDLSQINKNDEKIHSGSEDNDVSSKTLPETSNSLGQSRLYDRESYNYWIRRYTTIPPTFEAELDSRFPRSFAWVMRICANIIESTTFILYNHITHLESDLKYTLERNR